MTNKKLNEFVQSGGVFRVSDVCVELDRNIKQKYNERFDVKSSSC